MAAAPRPSLPSRLLFDNGPLITSQGTGAGGADESVLQVNSLGMTTLGTATQFPSFRVADDIRLTSTSVVETVTVFAYQVMSGTTPTINSMSFRIWDGVPGEEGSRVVFGDTTTNQLASVEFTNIYRVSENTLGNDFRPIMAITVEPNIQLGFGTYWFDWQLDGTLDNGPWTPHVTIPGIAETGNALQSFDNGETWQALQDNAVELDQAIPIQITGRQILTVPVMNPFASMMLVLLILTLAWRLFVRKKHIEDQP